MQSGRYQNASEVMREGLRLVEKIGKWRKRRNSQRSAPPLSSVSARLTVASSKNLLMPRLWSLILNKIGDEAISRAGDT